MATHPVTVAVDVAELREWAGKHADAGHHGVAHVLFKAAEGIESVTEQHDREVAARALDDAALTWQTGAWADVPRRADRVQERLATAQHVTNWLRGRAARARTPDTAAHKPIGLYGLAQPAIAVRPRHKVADQLRQDIGRLSASRPDGMPTSTLAAALAAEGWVKVPAVETPGRG